jgi:hypothetical protein
MARFSSRFARLSAKCQFKVVQQAVPTSSQVTASQVSVNRASDSIADVVKAESFHQNCPLNPNHPVHLQQFVIFLS